MIKKSFICLALVVISQLSFGQNIDKLFSEFSRVPDVENVSVSKLLTSMLKPFCKELKGIDSVNVLDMGECSQDVKKRFSKRVGELKDKNYETLARSNEEGENTQVLLNIKDKVIRELVVITTGNDCSLIRIKGKIKQSDIDSLVNR